MSADAEFRPTWEQLLTGVGLAPAASGLGTAPRHVRWPDEWADEWAAIVRGLRNDESLSWVAAWGWTAVAAAGAASLAAAGHAAGLLR